MVPSLAGCSSESPATIGPPTANRLDANRQRSAPDVGSNAYTVPDWSVTNTPVSLTAGGEPAVGV